MQKNTLQRLKHAVLYLWFGISHLAERIFCKFYFNKLYIYGMKWNWENIGLCI